MSRVGSKPIDWRYSLLASVALAVFFGLLYARLTATDLQFGDGGELTLAAATDGVAHPPGYPLWIIIAHAFTLLPLGTIPFRVGLFSAVCHAIAIGFVCASGILLTRNIFAGLFAGALLGTTPLFVTWSIQPEVFPLNDLFASAIVLCTLLLLMLPRTWWLLVVACALLGLGLANQQTLVALAPLLLVAVWYKRSELPTVPRRIAIGCLAVVVFAAGFLLPYLHTLAASGRALLWPYQTAHDPAQLVALITRRVFGTGKLVPDSDLQGGSIGERFRVSIIALWPVFPAVILGAVLAEGSKLRTWIPAIWAVVIAFAFAVVANINVQGDLVTQIFTRFALLPLVVLAPYAAFGLSWIGRLSRKRPAAATVACGMTLAIVLAAGFAYTQSRSLHDNHDASTFVRDAFATLPHGAVLLMWDEIHSESIPYFQIVDGWRPDVTAIAVPLLFHDYSPDYTALIERQGIALDGVANLRTGVEARDAIARANPTRAIYVAGWGPFTMTTSYTVEKMGLSGLLTGHARAAELATMYRQSVAAMSAPGYGDVTIDPRSTTGWGPGLAAQYAQAFASMGLYAKSAGDRQAARRWFTRALRYMPGDAEISAELASVQ